MQYQNEMPQLALVLYLLKIGTNLFSTFNKHLLNVYPVFP